MVFVRYIQNSDFKEEFLLCQPLDSQSRGIDVPNKVDTFLYMNVLIGVIFALFVQMELLRCRDVILVFRYALNRSQMS